jgi:hypothetical protein
MLNREASKEETIKAGEDLMSRATPEQQENHKKVIAWISTLKNIPSTYDPLTTYKHCLREWHAVFVLGKPAGTGSYNLETQ